MASIATVAVTLSPKAGFCVKTTTLQATVYRPKGSDSKPKPNSLEPKNGPITVAKGSKVFINIAWDANVPPPPEGSEEAIQRAMQGEDIDELNPDGWYVPVVVSEGRQDTDKVGNPSLVFDCVYHSSIKSRTIRDPEFKIFIIELALQRLEAQTPLILSRQIGTPNIASKGTLHPRTVTIPSFLSPKDTASASSPNKSKPLIEEIDPSSKIPDHSAKPIGKGILKTAPPSSSVGATPKPTLTGASTLPSGPETLRPMWSWAQLDDRLQITISVPRLTHSLIPTTNLYLEPRRLVLEIPNHPNLDINLALSDAEIVATSGVTDSADIPALTLKRQRRFDVEGAIAEWRVGERSLIVML